MRTWVIAACCAVLLSVPTFGQTDRRDGNWWNRQPRGSHLDYVLGFFDGMELGNTLSVPEKIDMPGGKVPDSVTRIWKTYQDRSQYYFKDVTVGQVADGLDEFYKDYRNRSIMAVNALELVVRSIKGEDIEALVRARRQLPD